MSERSLLRQGFEECGRVTQHHAKSFYLASHALDPLRRDAAYAVYAFCRRIDDSIDEAVRAAQIKEVHLMQSLPSHRHVVALRGYALSSDKFFICLEYCSGGSLLDYLNAHKTSKIHILRFLCFFFNVLFLIYVDKKHMAKWGAAVASAVGHLSSHNIVHRDIVRFVFLLLLKNILFVNNLNCIPIMIVSF